MSKERKDVTGKTYDVQLLQRVLVYMKPYRSTFIWSIILTVAMAAVAPLMPVLIEYTIDNFVLTANKDGLTMMGILMTVLLLFQNGIRYFHTLLTNTLGQSVIRDLRVDVFDHILNLRLKYFEIGRAHV